MASKQKKNGNVRFLHRRWLALLLAVGASAISLATYWYQIRYQPPVLESLDRRSRDFVLLLRQPPKPPPEVVVVSVDERSVKEFGRWPWPRKLQARILEALKAAGAGTIALDIVFARPYADECNCPDQDQALVDALMAPGAPVVGGYFFRLEKTSQTDAEAHQQHMDNRIRIMLKQPGSDLSKVSSYPFAETNRPEIARHFAGLGAFNRSTDVDGLVRRAPLVLGYQDELFPSLGLKALAVYAGVNEGVVVAPEGITEVRLDTFGIPVDAQGRLTVNFYDQKGGGIPIYSAVDVLSGQVGARELAGRLVFLGVTEIGIADLLPTPVNDIFPGVSMHATVAANILQQDYLYQNLDSKIIDILLIVFIPLIAVAAVLWMRNLWQMLLAFLIVAAGLSLLFYHIVAKENHLISVIYPAAALLTAFVAYQIYYMLTSGRTTRFLTGAFSSYVSPDLVDQLLTQPGSLGLSGDTREITVLFSDIREFTSISEAMKDEPERLVDMLNQYFDAMTQTVLEHQGTLDKYIGDAIMAIFNAPLSIENHQQQAARSALEMIQRLQAMQPQIQNDYGVDLHIGIGLHSGNAVVGNLGSSQRFDYTAIGDCVNLASRVESITKYYGVAIIVTEDIRAHLDASFVLRPLDNIRVKGKTQPAAIFQLMQPGDSNRRLAEGFTLVFGAYAQADFKQALSLLQDLQQDYPDDAPVRLYLQRCREFVADPPGPDWDGVYAATSK